MTVPSCRNRSSNAIRRESLDSLLPERSRPCEPRSRNPELRHFGDAALMVAFRHHPERHREVNR